MSLGELTDVEWALIAPFLPKESGRRGRPSFSNRVILNGILWRARTGAPWRDMPAAYGKWNTVWRRFLRWSQAGVFEALFEALARCGLAEERVQMLDSTTIRAHQHAAGGKGGLPARRSAAAVAGSRPSSTSAAMPRACLSPSC